MGKSALVCMPTSMGIHIEGSIKGTCSKCGKEVMIAPSSLNLLNNSDIDTICIICAMPMIGKGTHIGLSKDKQELYKEIKRHYKKRKETDSSNY